MFDRKWNVDKVFFCFCTAIYDEDPILSRKIVAFLIAETMVIAKHGVKNPRRLSSAKIWSVEIEAGDEAGGKAGVIIVQSQVIKVAFTPAQDPLSKKFGARNVVEESPRDVRYANEVLKWESFEYGLAELKEGKDALCW